MLTQNNDKWFPEAGEKGCPICGYTFDRCQCLFGGSAHPDRSRELDVVLHHLYLLTEKQLRHVIRLEKYWQISYMDDKKASILNKLKREAPASNE